MNTAEIHIKEPGGQEAGKINTVLLLKKNQEFNAFGSKALNTYFEDNFDGQDLLFEKFKMIWTAKMKTSQFKLLLYMVGRPII